MRNEDPTGVKNVSRNALDGNCHSSPLCIALGCFESLPNMLTECVGILWTADQGEITPNNGWTKAPTSFVKRGNRKSFSSKRIKPVISVSLGIIRGKGRMLRRPSCKPSRALYSCTPRRTSLSAVRTLGGHKSTALFQVQCRHIWCIMGEIWNN